jgi:hypothetical protein
MSASHESSWARRVWRDWRPEILRGAVLFVIVASVGVFFLRQVRAFEPLTLLRERGADFAGAGDGDRQWVDAFSWTGTVTGDNPVWIRNLNGAIVIERADAESVVVTAQKSWRHGDPESVRIVAVPSDGAVTICALWSGGECGPAGDYRMKGVKGHGHGDVAVRFVVRLPEGVGLDASTVNGSVSASGTEGALDLTTVNGSVAVESVAGGLKANTVNGSITADLADLTDARELDLQTVNGSITASVPPDIDAHVEASTVNGKVVTDLPVRVVGRVNPRKLQGTLGAGGLPMHFTTVNGSVTLLPAHMLASEGPPAPPAPRARPVPCAPSHDGSKTPCAAAERQ